MSTSEFLTKGYEEALDWAISLGLGGWIISSPITTNYDLVNLHGTENYFKVRNNKYCVLSIYARENPAYWEQSFGLQVISPLSRREIGASYIGDNSATLQWNNFLEDSGRTVVTVDLENVGEDYERRHVSFYYDDNKVSTHSSDIKSAELLTAINTIYYPTNLAIRLLSNSINTDNFDEMLQMLIA